MVRRLGSAGAAAVAVAVLVGGAGVGACSDDGSTSAPTSTTASTAPTTSATSPTSVTTPSTTAAPAAQASAGDWAGERWDLGTVARMERRDGRLAVVFDRQQLDGKSGKQLTEEPVLGGYRSGEVANDNDQLRTFFAADGVEVLRLANRDEACDPQREVPLKWDRMTVGDVMAQRIWTEWILVSLTFDKAGAVTRIRFSSDC